MGGGGGGGEALTAVQKAGCYRCDECWARRLGAAAGRGGWARRLGAAAGRGGWARRLGAAAGRGAPSRSDSLAASMQPHVQPASVALCSVRVS